MQKKREEVLQWHPAFYAELQVEFIGDTHNMCFENEHQLGTKPKEIDVLIIKKNTDEPVRKNIGRIFKKHNIIEYKSPTDYLSVDDFYKVYAYACLYKVDTEIVDSIKVEDITINFFCYHWPRKLVQHLQKDRGYHVRKVEGGIYYIEGDIIPMQLILISELSEDENLWLRSLTNRLPDNNVDKLITEYQNKKDNKLYRSVMNAIVRANKDKFGGNDMCEALEEIFEEKFKERFEERYRSKLDKEAQELAEQKAQALGNLISNLIKLGRIDDAEKAATDVVYRESLYQEFELV